MHKSVARRLKFVHKNVVNELKFVHKNVNNGKKSLQAIVGMEEQPTA